MTYNAKRAIADFGFVEAYARIACLPGNDIWFDAFIESLARIDSYIRQGHLLGCAASKEETSGFLYDVGFIRGSIYRDKIPFAVSEALSNFITFVTGCDQWTPARPEAKNEMLSDADRDVLMKAAGDGKCLFHLGLWEEIDATQEAIVRYTCQELGATDYPEAEQWAEEARLKWESENSSGGQAQAAASTPAAEPTFVAPPEKAAPVEQFAASAPEPAPIVSRREWSTEQRAAAANRAKGPRKPPFKEHFESVKSDFDAGLSCGAISRKWGCSEQHIRNFLMKHGVDPRRSAPGVRNGGSPALTEAEKQLIIDEKAKGTPSKEIGEMVDRSQHAVDQTYGNLKKAGMVPAEHLTPEFLAARKQKQNELVSQTMKETHAAKRDALVEPVEESEEMAQIAATSIPSPADSWKPLPLSADDWSDIQTLLAKGNTRESIASDFDVPVADLNRFIEQQLELGRQRRASKDTPSGEAEALLAS